MCKLVPADHRVREHADPVASLCRGVGRERGQPTEPEIPAELQDGLILDLKRKLYADWSDHPLPALDGETARDAVKTTGGRRRVELLLKEMEHLESKSLPGQRFDFDIIRRELGMDSP